MRTIVVFGGGQLGQMIAQAGQKIDPGLRFVFLDKSADVCAKSEGEVVVTDFSDPSILDPYIKADAVFTSEWESMPWEWAKYVEDHGGTMWPSSEALRTFSDRNLEKNFLRTNCDLSVAPFVPVKAPSDVEQILRLYGRAVIKTCLGGYDGKGQERISSRADIVPALRRLWGDKFEQRETVPLIAEKFLDHDGEFSVVVTSGIKQSPDQLVLYDLVRNDHHEGILRLTRTVGVLSRAPQKQAHTAARRIATQMGYVGTFAIEFFLYGERLVVNEVAPRVHNSGHGTIEGAFTSQFENHVRAILGWPLKRTTAPDPWAMINVIAEVPEVVAKGGLRDLPGVYVHMYGKSPRPGRKLGHITVVAKHETTRDEMIRKLVSMGVPVPGTEFDIAQGE